MNANLTFRLQEDQEADFDKEEEEDLQQLVFRIGGILDTDPLNKSGSG